MEIPAALQIIVYESVKILGQAIKEIYGEKIFLEIEKIRIEMKKIRNQDGDTVFLFLEKLYQELSQDKAGPLHQKAKAFSLMLELINICEAAYRSFRLRDLKIHQDIRAQSMMFVFTSHPTEARSPQFLFIMDKIQFLILKALKIGMNEVENEIFYLLKIAVKIDLANNKKPDVKDEAAQIFSTVLNKNILDEQLTLIKNGTKVYFKTWAGGDKDGHSLVGPKTMIESLTLSRNKLIDYIFVLLDEFQAEMEILKESRVLDLVELMKKNFHALRKINRQDATKLLKMRGYLKRIKINSPIVEKLEYLLTLYPALVLSLELREDSELIHAALLDSKSTIALMLKELKKISKGLDPRGYVNSFVVSMCTTDDDLVAAALLTKKILGNLAIPIVPLFENEKGLTFATKVLSGAFLKFPFIIEHNKRWDGLFEVMLGYSDSTKENGVLPGRLMVEQTAYDCEEYLLKMGLTPSFFHGSGGSINRGGGSVKEQLSWLPKSSLDFYKATIQGETVQRHFHHSLIMRSQINKIVTEISEYQPRKFKHSDSLGKFSKLIQEKYKLLMEDANFQTLVQEATPYVFLNFLKIGSRPLKRTGVGKFTLRAIPWTLCWTQTRLLLPFWWGVGAAYKELSLDEKLEIKKDYQVSPLLQTYVKNLGFALAKIEIGVWRFYLDHSKLSTSLKKQWREEIEAELNLSHQFFKEITDHLDLLWFRPWLRQSIFFRSSMIHPLNVIQKIAFERNDYSLLRETVTGISCGMLTTG